VSVSDLLRAKVLSIEYLEQKISLSLKQ
jgi:ribosomal protein S1